MKKPIIIEILILTFVLTIIFAIGIFTYAKIFVEPNIYQIQFKDIDGITKGSPVRFMGINVGYVRNLKYQNKHIDAQIIVTKKDMKIPNGTVARVEFYGLGGSKSIELMPPDGSCNVGILTNDTIRLNDVVNEAIGIIEIVETMEQYVKNLNPQGMVKILDTIQNFKNDKIKNAKLDINTVEQSITDKVNVIKNKQNEMSDKIEHINNNVEKLNQFIKK